MVGIPVDELQERFGEFLVPDLPFMYRKLMDPSWDTLAMLEHVETQMHGAVRRDLRGSTPPVLHVERFSPNTVRVQYVSKRRMGALAVGIVRGLAHHFGEHDQLRIAPTTREDGDHVDHVDHVEILVERVARTVPSAA